MMDETRKNNPLVSTMLMGLIVLSPLEHVMGVEKLLYTVGLLVAGLCVLYRKRIVIDETSALLLFLGYALGLSQILCKVQTAIKQEQF